VFFLHDKVGRFYNLFNFIHVNIIDVNADKSHVDRTQGLTTVVGNEIFIDVNIKEITKITEAKMGFSDFATNLMFVILREIGNVVYMLKKYKHNKEKMSLEEHFDEMQNSISKRFQSHLSAGVERWHVNRTIKECIAWDKFAFVNLNYFKSLCDFNGILV
jgi:hypothetical protein